MHFYNRQQVSAQSIPLQHNDFIRLNVNTLYWSTILILYTRDAVIPNLRPIPIPVPSVLVMADTLPGTDNDTFSNLNSIIYSNKNDM